MGTLVRHVEPNISGHSVHWGMNPPQNTTPYFSPSRPFLGNPPYRLVFREPPPKNRIFQ